VGSDNPDAKGLNKAAQKRIPTFVVTYSEIIRDFKKNPDKSILPADFDLKDIGSKQSFFKKDADTDKVNFPLLLAIAEDRLLK
jgi:phosphoribosylglycinamide formyltransferase-1